MGLHDDYASPGSLQGILLNITDDIWSQCVLDGLLTPLGR
jgi:hypothetical protein